LRVWREATTPTSTPITKAKPTSAPSTSEATTASRTLRTARARRRDARHGEQYVHSARAWSFVEFVGDGVEFGSGHGGEVEALGEVLPEQAVGVLVGGPLLPKLSRAAK
jgi:hypothetical protein